jgi:hypothetical protein
MGCRHARTSMKGRLLRSALALLVALVWTAAGTSNSAMDQFVECLNTDLVPHSTSFEDIKGPAAVRCDLLPVAERPSYAWAADLEP